MKRDGVVPILLGTLAALSLPTAGLVPRTLAPATYLRLALLGVGFVLLLVVPWVRGRGTPGRLLLVVVVSLPFLAFGVLETPARPGTVVVPGLAWAFVAVAALLAVLAPSRPARVLTVLVLALWGADALLARAGAALLPSGWNPADLPLAAVGDPSPGGSAPLDSGDEFGWKPGAPVPLRGHRRRALTAGTGPWFEPAARGRFGPAEPLLLVLGPAGTPASEVFALPDVGVFVPESEVLRAHALELDAFAAAVVLPGAWQPDAPDAAARADRLAVFTRRGGILVGPAHETDWPAPLGRRLGAAGRVRGTGSRAGRACGLGRVVRAASDEGMRDLLRVEVGPGAERGVGTVFDPPPRAAPALPPALTKWEDDPAARRDQGILLVVYALVAAALDRVLGGRAAARALAAGLAVAAVGAGLYWVSPRLPAARLHAVALDLGGGGGRRVEALAIAAGPAGWAGHVKWQGDGVVWVLGGQLQPDGRLRVAPDRTAWAIRDRVARGGGSALEAHPRAAFLTTLLTGPVAYGRLEPGLSGPLALQVDGGTPPRTWTLRFRRSQP